MKHYGYVGEEEEDDRHDILYKTERGRGEACKKRPLLSYRTCGIKATVRGAEDIASELMALVCGIKLITEGSLCSKTDETVPLKQISFQGCRASPD